MGHKTAKELPPKAERYTIHLTKAKVEKLIHILRLYNYEDGSKPCEDLIEPIKEQADVFPDDNDFRFVDRYLDTAIDIKYGEEVKDTNIDFVWDD